MYLIPHISTVSLASAGTEYPVPVLENTRKLEIKSRANGTLKIGLNSGDTAGTEYITVAPGSSFVVEAIYLKASTLYVTSDTASDRAEVLAFTD